MADRIYVKPAPGCKVPDYEMNDFIPADGRLVLRTVHVIRRLNDQSLVICDPPPAPAAAEPQVDPPADPPADPEDPPRRSRSR